ncbi:unnamed protein product [Haemonchus placei]|uniref:1-acylglycerol-3-phosphate O-acyltransferase n=1 Tax=Haemonchus placei TaxID=6290 RepID=A0A0N4WGP4_HAEPC|nr:unnamed protein product [Haemonchus placei]
MDDWITVLLFICCAALLILYNVSQWCNYIMRISFFYLCIFLHGVECNITMIPSWIAGSGADLIFHTFKYWTLWTGINVDVRGFEENLKKLSGSAVVICNHQSTVDVVAMTRVWPPRGTVMMKESLKYIPFFNLTSIFANAVFVKRFKRGRVSDTIEQCVKQMKKYNLKRLEREAKWSQLIMVLRLRFLNFIAFRSRTEKQNIAQRKRWADPV